MTTRRAQNIGHVTKTKAGSFEGVLALMNFQGNIVITPITDREEGKDAPDYAVNSVSENGSLFRIGSARNKTAKSSGNNYVAVMVDYFEITSKPIFANLVQDRDDKAKLNILV